MPTGNLLAASLIIASATVSLALGVVHLAYTFRGRMLAPRDERLLARMQEVSPRITRQTTMWNVWIGVNATHSISLILFGSVYGYLALVHSELLFHSAFLQALGLAVQVGYVALARKYFFRTPLRAVAIGACLFALGALLAWA